MVDYLFFSELMDLCFVFDETRLLFLPLYVYFRFAIQRSPIFVEMRLDPRPRPLCVLWLSHSREEPMYSVVGETIMLDHDHYACCDAVAIAVWSVTIKR